MIKAHRKFSTYVRWGGIFLVTAIVVVTAFGEPMTRTKKTCDEYADEAFKDVPARCIDYWMTSKKQAQ